MGRPTDLASNFVVLDKSFSADIAPVMPELYEHLGEECRSFAGHVLVSSYSI